MIKKEIMINQKLNIVIESVKNEMILSVHIPYGMKYADAYDSIEEIRQCLEAMEKKSIENKAAAEQPQENNSSESTQS
jgi:sugar-specific transcriptional regulator TrmB